MAPAPCISTAELEAAVAGAAAAPGGGILAIFDSFLTEHRDFLITLVTRHRLPAIYGSQFFTPGGGLMSYASDYPDIFRRAADYVDRILRGTRPGDLPVQEPAKFTLSVNLKAAAAIGLTLPQSLELRPRRRGDRMRRRDFIALAGGLTAWPLAARAQQDNRVRRIGVFMNLSEGDPDGTRWIAALLKSLDEFGWTEGRNIRIDFRWGIDAEHIQKNAEGLVALNPDVIVAATAAAVSRCSR